MSILTFCQYLLVCIYIIFNLLVLLCVFFFFTKGESLDKVLGLVIDLSCFFFTARLTLFLETRLRIYIVYLFQNVKL